MVTRGRAPVAAGMYQMDAAEKQAKTLAPESLS